MPCPICGDCTLTYPGSPRSGVVYGRSKDGVLVTMPDGYEVKQEDYVEATERLYLNADKSKVVPEGSPEAAFLFATPGKRVLKKEAEKYGLLKAQKAAPEDKAVKAAPENKSK